MSPEKQERDPGRRDLEDEFRAMFAERSETVRIKTAPYAAVRQRIVSARRKRRMRIGSAGVAFAVAVVGIGVGASVPARHHDAIAPTSSGPKVVGVPAKVLYADGRTEIPAGPLRNAALGWLGTNYRGDLTGLTVVTTFDRGVQAAAEVKASAADTGVAVVDARNGAVLALGGAWDRQTEVADLMKPIALAAAFETGHYTPDSKEPLDTQKHPLSWPPSAKQPMTYYATGKGQLFWPPESPGTAIHDVDVTLTQAAETGANGPFAQLELASDINITQVYDLAKRIGVPEHAPDFTQVPSLILGTAEITPLTMATIYAAFADNGIRHDPRLVGLLLGKDGRPVWTPKDTAAPVIAPDVAQEVVGVLHSALADGLTGTGIGSAVKSDAAAGAMAAADSMEHSAWVDGIESHYAIAVGLSNMDPSGTMHPVEAKPAGGGVAVGSRLAGPTWERMVEAVRAHG